MQKVIKEKNFASGRSREETVWVAAPYVNGISEAIARVLRPLGISLAHSSASWQWSICEGLKDNIANISEGWRCLRGAM